MRVVYHRAMRCAPALIAAALFGCGQGPGGAQLPPPEVPVITVVARSVPIYDEWVGQTRGAADIEIRARVTGFIEAIHFDEGGPVAAGDLLYSIDSSELEQNLAAERARLAQSQTMYADAAANLARYRPLAAMNAVSQSDLDERVAREGAAANEVEAARAGVRVAEINFGYASVRAPIAGQIGLSKVRVGDLVSPTGNSLLNTVSAIDSVRVRFAVSEREYLDYSRRYGSEVRDIGDPRALVLELLLADGSKYPQSGQLVSIDSGVDPATGTLTLEAAFPNPDSLLRPGLFARIRAVTEQRDNAIVVPQRAVSELQGRYQVYVVGADDTVEIRAVEVGPRIGNDWLIDQGVMPNERLILAGIQRLRAGMKVVPVAATAAPAAAEPQ